MARRRLRENNFEAGIGPENRGLSWLSRSKDTAMTEQPSADAPLPLTGVLTSESQISAALAFSIISGIISVIGSTTIIVVLLRSPKKLTSTYRRLVFGMSCFDVLHSISYVASGLPAPQGTNDTWARNTIGNTATCNIQGLVTYTGMMGSVFYDCMLSIYFVLVVVYSKREDFIQKRIEPFFHATAILIPVGAGIFLLVTKRFNWAGSICWINNLPPDCDMNEDIDCTRGANAKRYRWIFAGYPVLLVLLIVIGCMLRLSWSIRKQLTKMKKYGASQFASKVNKKRRESIIAAPSTPENIMLSKKIGTSAPRKSQNETKQTFTQAILYVMALIFTFFFAFVYNLTRRHYALYLLQVIFMPLLGFFNFFIFIRPRVVMTRQSKPELSFFQAFRIAVTAKEVISPSGRRGSVAMRMRRSCTTNLTGRRSSLISSDATLAAAARVVQAEDEHEMEQGLEEMESDSPSNNVHGLDVISSASQLNSLSGPEFMERDHPLDSVTGLEVIERDHPLNSISGLNHMPKNTEAQDIEDPSNAVDGTFNMTEDYTNML